MIGFILGKFTLAAVWRRGSSRTCEARGDREEGRHGLPGWGEVVALDLGCGRGL